ncbi:hypothetical protein D3C84_1139380 [compost metagenome]
MAVEHSAYDLAAGADKGFAVLDLIAPGVAAEEADGRIGIAQADDRLQWVFTEAFIDFAVDAFGGFLQVAAGLALGIVERHAGSLQAVEQLPT